MSRRSIIALVGAAALVLTGAAAAEAAPGTTKQWVASPNGVVGVQQTVTLQSWASRNKVATVTFTAPSGASNAGQAAFNAQGIANLPWTPNLPGTWSIAATAPNANLGSTSITVAAVPTWTYLLVPQDVQASAQTNFTVQVSTGIGSITPSGTITVRNQSNGLVTTGTLSPTTTPGIAYVNLAFTPTPGPLSLIATYTPATSAFTGSVSPAQNVNVGSSVAFAIRTMPPVYAGVPTTVTAQLGAGVASASAALQINDLGVTTYLGGSRVSNAQGLITFPWTPTAPGYPNLYFQWMTPDNAQNGTLNLPVAVLPAPVTNSITVVPAGAPAWGPGLVGTLTGGSSVALTAGSKTGGPVTLATSGPCVINGSTLTVLSAGTCSISAASAAAPGYTAAAVGYTVNIVAPPKKK